MRITLAIALLVGMLCHSVAHAAGERIAVLELRGAVDANALRLMTDEVRRGVLDAVRSGDFMVMTRENMALIAKDMGKDLSCMEGECEVETGRNIGADYVISGEVVDVGGRLNLVLKLHDTSQGALSANQRAQAEGINALLDAAAALGRAVTVEGLSLNPGPQASSFGRVQASSSASFGSGLQMDVQSKLREKRCSEAAESRGKAQREAKLDEEGRKIEEQAMARWREMRSNLEDCTELDYADRDQCRTAVNGWLRGARTAEVSLPDGEETVQTDCGDRVAVFAAQKRTVPISTKTAESMLKRLNTRPKRKTTPVRPRATTRSSGGGWVSCSEVLNLLAVGVPANTVTQTMKASRAAYTLADIDCLARGGAPASVVHAARSKVAPSASGVSKPQYSHAAPSASGVSKPQYSRAAPAAASTDPAIIQQAVKLIKLKKPLTATYRLYDALKSGNYPDQTIKIHYYLARGLEQLEMYHSAQHFFLEVVNAGPSTSYFKYALPKLVTMAGITGDDSDLMLIAPRIPPEAYPRKSKNQMYYLMGLRKMKESDLSAAQKYFSQVSSKSSLYLKSRYHEAVIYNKQGKLKSAVRAFRDVARWKPEEGKINRKKPTREEVQIMALQDLSLINIGRVYYKIERYSEAFKFYQLVPQGSVYRQQAEYEMEWAYFLEGSASIPDDVILKHRQTAAKREAKLDKKRAKGKAPPRDFLPEATYLLSLRQYQHCGYACAEKTLADFEAEIKPVQSELQAVVKRYATKEGRRMADRAWDAYFGANKKQTTLPKSLLHRMLRNQDIRGMADHMSLMDDEIKLIDKQKPQWRDTVGEMLKRDVIEKDRRILKVRAGKFMLAEMARNANTLQDLLTQSEIVRVNIVEAKQGPSCGKSGEMVCDSPEGF